jgi:hypothetical protein
MKEKASVFAVSWYDRGERLFCINGASPIDVLRRLMVMILRKYQIAN